MDLEFRHCYASPRQHRELAAFASYCVARIEHDLGEMERWSIKVAPMAGGFGCTIAVHADGQSTTADATRIEATLAIWDAMCVLEARLRERGQRGHRARMEE